MLFRSVLEDALSEVMKVSSLRKAEFFFGRYHTLHVRAEQGVALCCGGGSEVKKELGAKRKSRRNKCDQEESRFPEELCGDRCEEVVEDGFGLCERVWRGQTVGISSRNG